MDDAPKAEAASDLPAEEKGDETVMQELGMGTINHIYIYIHRFMIYSEHAPCHAIPVAVELQLHLLPEHPPRMVLNRSFQKSQWMIRFLGSTVACL